MTTRTTVEYSSALDSADRVSHACYIARVAAPFTERRSSMIVRRLLILTPLVTALAACSDPTQFELTGGVAVSFATRDPGVAPTPPFAPSIAAFFDDTVTSGSDTLIIARARIVLREIELKRTETPDCDVEPEPVGCEEIELGPVLVDLPLEQGAEQRFFVELPTGNYSRIDFELHKPDDDDPADLAFITANPEFADQSIRLEGTFNGIPFSFMSDVDAEQELDLTPPLTVAETVAVNVTIRIELDSWFRTATGTLVDPATANKGGQNESLVTENIKQSLEAFEDDDRDGDDD